MIFARHSLTVLCLLFSCALTIIASEAAVAQNRFAQAPVYPLGNANGFVAADFNGDRRADLLYNWTSDNGSAAGVVLSMANAAGGYTAPKMLVQLKGILATGDFNEDGLQDF